MISRRAITWRRIAAFLIACLLVAIGASIILAPRTCVFIFRNNGAPFASMSVELILAGGAQISQVDPGGTLVLEWPSDGKPDFVMLVLKDGPTTVFSGFLRIPRHGEAMVDFRGNRTIRKEAAFRLGPFGYSEETVTIQLTNEKAGGAGQ